MKIKYLPCLRSKSIEARLHPESIFEFVNENALRIDGVLYEFDENSDIWPEIFIETDHVISEAFRDDSGELNITARRFYSTLPKEWDTGEYHEVVR